MTTGAQRDDGVPFGMTDLEERLRSDGGDQVRAAVLSRLAQLDRDIGDMVRRGLAREEFHRAEAIQGAVAAASGVLIKRT